MSDPDIGMWDIDRKITYLEQQLSAAKEDIERLKKERDEHERLFIHIKGKSLDSRLIKGHFCEARAICDSITDSITQFMKLRKQAQKETK